MMYLTDLGNKVNPFGELRGLPRRVRLLNLAAAVLLSRVTPRFIARNQRLHKGLLRYLSAPPLFVYTPKKTGTWSVFCSLARAYNGLVYQRNERFDWRVEASAGAGDARRFVMKVEWRGRAYAPHPRAPLLAVNYDAVWPGAPIKLIALVREPIGRDVSEFFQLAYQGGYGVGVSRSQLTTLSTADLRAAFLKFYRRSDPMSDWFDANIKDLFGIDVYAEPFSSAGCGEYANGRVKLLLLKSALAEERKAAAIGAFAGIPDFKLRRYNETDGKVYAAAYARFKREVKLPRDYVDGRCESRFARHFFSADELKQTRRRWLAADEERAA